MKEEKERNLRDSFRGMEADWAAGLGTRQSEGKDDG